MTRRPNAVDAVRAVMVARDLRRISPHADTVRITPVYTDAGPRGPRIAVRVNLADVLHQPLAADPGTYRTAYAVLCRAYPQARWMTDDHRYDVRAGRLLARPPLPSGAAG
ncbi:hypothetical protein [Streptomyces sp. NPDC002104]